MNLGELIKEIVNQVRLEQLYSDNLLFRYFQSSLSHYHHWWLCYLTFSIPYLSCFVLMELVPLVQGLSPIVSLESSIALRGTTVSREM